MEGEAQRPDPHPLAELASQLTIPAAVCCASSRASRSSPLPPPGSRRTDEGTILTEQLRAARRGAHARRRLPRARHRLALIYGARVTLGLALAISVLAFLIGSAAGFLAAVRGAGVDAVLSRIVDALISFPAIMIALIVISGSARPSRC